VRPALHAQELPLSLTQYAHTAWRVQDGSFIGLPRSLAQTSDGYLWVGTSKGLQRYDGERFEDVHMQPSIVNLPPSITSLAPASDGSLWITTNTALAHLDKGVVTYLPTGLIHANGIIEDHRRQIWMVRSRDPKGPLCQVYGTTLKCHGKSDGIACPYSNTLAESQSGTLWLGSNPLCAWKDGHAEVFVPSGSTDPAANESINALAPRPDDSVFVGFSEPGPHLGLQLLTSGKYSPVVYPGFDGRTMSIESLKLDRTGGLWVGTETQGLFHLHDGISDHFGAADGLSGDRVTDILEDKEGNLWVATRNGVDQFHHYQ